MSLHIALCGPATLSLLQDHVTTPIETDGYPFPVLSTLAIEYLALGHRVTLVTTAIDIQQTLHYSGDRLDVYVIASRPRARTRAFDFFSAERKGISAALDAASPDVIHAHWTYEFALAATAAAVAPVLVTAHDAPLTILRNMPDPYRLIRTLMAIRARLSIRNLTAVSPYLAQNWRREMLYTRPITIISNPAPQIAFTGHTSRPDHPVILDVANGSKLKNVRALVRAFAEVRAMFPSTELRLVGPGLGFDDILASWAAANGLASGVSFMGHLGRDEVARQYAEATIFCHASLEESQGISLVEAMCAGLPIVAGSKSGAVGWTLFEGDGGDLVDVSKPAAIATALADRIAKGFVDSDGERVRSMALSRYGAEVIAGAYLKVYDRLLMQKPRRT